MQLHAPLHTTPYHKIVLLSLQCGKKQRPCKHTYENFARFECVFCLAHRGLGIATPEKPRAPPILLPNFSFPPSPPWIVQRRVYHLPHTNFCHKKPQPSEVVPITSIIGRGRHLRGLRSKQKSRQFGPNMGPVTSVNFPNPPPSFRRQP